MAKTIKIPSAQWKRASKINWLLFVVAGAAGSVYRAAQEVSKDITERSWDTNPGKDYLELLDLECKANNAIKELHELQEAIKAYNAAKVARREAALKKAADNAQ